MKLYLVKTPRFIKSLFSKYTWSFASTKKEIYLTFDDGPTPEVTEFVLQELGKYNAKATFFCIGKNIEAQPQLFQRIINSGHTVGNHTHNHFNGWKTNTLNYLENIEKAEKFFSKKPKLFRPPYGKIKSKQTNELLKKGYKIIMWDVLSGDFDQSISKEKCYKNVLQNTENGSIIVFHDSIKAKEKLYYTLPKILKNFSEKGYTFKAIS